jgi:predicted nucleotidyltransferase
MSEVLTRFASFSVRRQWLGEQLQELLNTAKSSGFLFRVILWGSFVTSKESPNDLDVLLIMDEAFDSEQVLGDTKLLFDYTQARIRFTADVFWTKATIDPTVLELWLDTYQTGRDFKRRGIVEVIRI